MTFSLRFPSSVCRTPRFGVLGIVALVLLPISGCGSPDPETMKAVEKAKHIMQELENDRFQVVWECWTDQQRDDVNQVVHKFAEKAPPRLWDNAMEVVRLWGKLLKEKREFALNCPHLEKGHTSLKEYGDELSGFLMAVAESDARDLEKLQNANVGELFKQLDPHLMRAAPALFHLMPNEGERKLALETYQNGLAAFADATVSVRESGDGWAELEFSTSDTQAARVRFVKADGRWVPNLSTDAEWNESIRQANKWLDGFDPAQMPELEMVNVALATIALPHLEQALKAETQAEFDALFENGPNPVLPLFFFAGEKKFSIPQQAPVR